ncbi:GPP34 family phosphoprotein [Paractinoplanes hotanensis]|uniref:GPP34 family phosphoprotein n=1 Tax=Paractinoplanes hotanensis TaxID=2906497 RepID=A0ABT0XWX5_9ACTN|nr:GPP34 family phosphoprotein [Actinoplanes hotanensis]MCM4078292.1 GPP34 family phosphoprotein [Actinoplanes hotanensis]
MPSAGPTWLTDDLWLAAHDGVKGARLIGERPLGVGLAAGLLAELVHAGWLELREGELFRTGANLPSDPALRPLLVRMEAEEQERAAVQAREDEGRGPRASERGSWPPPVRQETRHRLRGHQLKAWMAYLAYEGRAEARVVDRLSRTGLVRREERRRLFGGTTARYVPCDANASGLPANSITQAVHHGRPLPGLDAFLAGLLLATGLHHHAFATLSTHERSLLGGLIKTGLTDPGEPGIRAMLRELLRAADAAVGEAAMR